MFPIYFGTVKNHGGDFGKKKNTGKPLAQEGPRGKQTGRGFLSPQKKPIPNEAESSEEQRLQNKKDETIK